MTLSMSWRRDLENSKTNPSKMIEFFTTNGAELLIGFMAFAKVVVNLIPSAKPIQVWTWVDTLINAIVADKRSDGKEG